MAGLSPYAAAPPPPPIGGNRKTKHIVGGSTSNVAYAPGNNLQQARTAYQTNQTMARPQNALQRGFFQGQTPEAPNFSSVGTNQMQAGQGLSAPNALGNTLNQFAMGNVRAPNAPAGLGFGRSNALGVVRQHTITGNEGFDAGMTYTPSAAPPPPPPAPVAPQPSAPVTPAPTTGGNGTGGVVGGTGGNISTVPAGPRAPIYISNGFSVDMFKWKAMNVWSIPLGKYVAKSLDNMSTQEVFNALQNGQNNGALADDYYLADKNSIKKKTATTPTAPTTPPPPPPPAPAPAGPAPAPAPVASAAQLVRQKYGAVAVGTRVYGSDGMQRIVQKRAVNPATGTQVPWVNQPGGGLMVHPDWQGI